MSVLSTVELLCYFESLRNVDLFEQGFYCVRSKIYTEKSNIAAVPLTHYNTSSPARKIDNPRHKLFPPKVAPERNVYSTKTFWVQYTEEVIDINEAVHFRIEVPDLETQSLLLEMELLFSPEENTNNVEQLKPVSTQKYRIKSIQHGMNQFYPITFDEWHFAVVRFSIHTCLIDFSYKPSIASFLRFSSFSSPPGTTEQDRLDVSLFGVPCRHLLQDSYFKLSKHFHKLCFHVPTKQRAVLGNDFFVAPPLSVTLPPTTPLSSKSASAPSSPVTSKHNNNNQSNSNSNNNNTNTTSPPQSPLVKPRSYSLFSRSSASTLISPPLPLSQSTDSNNGNNSTNSNMATTDLTASNNTITGSVGENDTYDESSDDESTNETSSINSPASSSSASSSGVYSTTTTITSPNAYEAEKQVNPLKLFLLLDNVRDHNGVGSPRIQTSVSNSSTPTSTSTPTTTSAPSTAPSSATSTTTFTTSPPDPKPTTDGPMNGNSSATRVSPPSSGASTPRLSASTGNRPSPRDCASATFGFFSRPTTPMSPPSSLPSSPTSTAARVFGEAPPDYTALTKRAKAHSLPSVPSIMSGEELRRSRERNRERKNKRKSVTFTTRPPLGPVPQELRTKEIMAQIHYIGDQIFALWVRFTKVFHLVGKENTFRIAQSYEQKYLRLVRDSVFREVAHVSSLSQMLELQANPLRHRQMVQSVRSSEYYKKLKSARFDLVIQRPELAGQPIILEQFIDTTPYATPEDQIIHLSLDDSAPPASASRSTTPPPPLSPSSSSSSSRKKLTKQHSFVNNPPKAFAGSHLYIMVHGLAGNPWDLRMFRNQIAINFPESEFLICSCVEQNTLGDIEEMGGSVAKEIDEYLKNCSLQIGKISFVGHSLGGVIIRAALCDPLLAPYLDKLYTFVSLSVPHIGTLYPYSSLIPSAMWVWQKWSNSACLLQLRLIDHPDPTKTYLYKLSQKKGLEYFQNILLVSSEQDLYVPFHSARVELCQEALAEGKKEDKKSEKLNGNSNSSPLIEMVSNMWDSVLEGWRKRGRFGEIVRYDVVFESHRGMDGMIGRSAHIRLLDSPKVMQMLITTNANLFN